MCNKNDSVFPSFFLSERTPLISSMFLLLLVFLLLFYNEHGWASGNHNNECEKRCHINLTAKQKSLLCEGQASGEVGPALCSQVAKDILRLQFDDVYRLCYGALSVMPSSCLKMLHDASSGRNQPPGKRKRPISSTSLRGLDGISLCRQANSTNPARCMIDLLSYTGTNSLTAPAVATTTLVDYCREMDDLAVLDCIDSAHSYLKVHPQQAMTPCKYAASPGSSSSSSGGHFSSSSTDPHHSNVFSNDPTAADSSLSPIALCMEEMRPFVSRSGGKGPTATEVCKTR